MKKIALLVLVLTSLSSLSGCVAYPYNDGRGYGPDGVRHGERNRDRDGDGVRNRDDRRPDNPNRY